MFNTFVKCVLAFCLAMGCGLMAEAQSSNPVGNAYLSSEDCFVLTNASEFQLGAVWFNEQLNLSDSFEMELLVNFGSSDANGADGMVFIMQQVGINALGEAGGGMGFGGFQPSFGVEMDTYQNQDLGDPFQDHMALLVNGNVNHFTPGNLLGPVSIDAGGANVEDGQDHFFKLTWDPVLDVVKVFFDCELRLELNIDLVADVFNGNPEVFWGFSGATGGLVNVQSVCISNYALGLPDVVSVCSGESIELGVVGTDNGSYEWSPTTYLDTPNESTTLCTPEENIQYTVTYTDLCGTQIQEELSVEVIPFSPDLQESLVFCEGETVTVSAVGDPDWEYVWSNDVNGQEAQFSEEGVYTLTVSEENCSQSFDLEVSTLPLPEIDWLAELEACEGELITFDASLEGATYLWHDASISNSYATNMSELVEVELTSADGCVQSYEGNAIIHEIPNPNLPNEISLCDGEEVVLSPEEGNVVQWSNGVTENQITVSSEGQFSVEVLSDANCLGFDTTQIVFNASPQWNFNNTFTICEGESMSIAYPSQYEITSALNTDADSVYFSEPGEFNITLSDQATLCSSNFSLFVDEVKLPTLDLPERLNLCEGEVLEFQAAAQYASTAFWDDGEEGEFRVFDAPGIYALTVENQCGEANDQLEIVELICDCPIYIPTAFTPNQDGVNDFFIHEISCDHFNYDFKIYDRWGTMVFSADEPGILWDGSVRGGTHFAEDEVYTWHLKVELLLPLGAKIIDRVGHVTVLR